ncbi:hypothetical protein CALCODRAFT_483642 [Calocera cornea HHB12733]|uniref:Non-classical export protein 1 n=1 Tax=Calocera cornea HHB12733 TaxID=1353952 RepID=A0A165FKK8_9BASI|nr:hypothetical protein CALCODRAFT_483642 [Calocera cornea HHB12733]
MSVPIYYLFGKYVDPLFGVFTGAVAYYLWENHPRTAPPQGSHLADLIKWRFTKPEDRPKHPDWDRIKADLQQMEKELAGPGGQTKQW